MFQIESQAKEIVRDNTLNVLITGLSLSSNILTGPPTKNDTNKVFFVAVSLWTLTYPISLN